MRAVRNFGFGLVAAVALSLTVTGSSSAAPVRGELVIDGKMVLAAPALGACNKVTVKEGMRIENRTNALAYFFPDAQCAMAEPCMVAASKGGAAHAPGESVMFLEDKPQGHYEG